MKRIVILIYLIIISVCVKSQIQNIELKAAEVNYLSKAANSQFASLGCYVAAGALFASPVLMDLGTGERDQFLRTQFYILGGLVGAIGFGFHIHSWSMIKKEGNSRMKGQTSLNINPSSFQLTYTF